MGEDDIKDLWIAIISQVLTAVIAGATVVTRDWRIRRTATGLQNRAFEQATRQVTFIDTWLSVYSRATDKDRHNDRLEQAVSDLEHAYATVLVATTAQTQTDRRTTSDVAKAVLLFPLRTSAARTVRVFYYIFLLLGVLIPAILVASIFDDSVAVSVAFSVLFAIIFSVVCLIPAVILWLVAQHLERRSTKSPQHASDQSSPRPSWATEALSQLRHVAASAGYSVAPPPVAPPTPALRPVTGDPREPSAQPQTRNRAGG